MSISVGILVCINRFPTTAEFGQDCPRFFWLMESNIHIGQLIQSELRRQGRGVTWFATQICCERTNVYTIFKRKSIDTELLLRISQVLNHDFFRYYTAKL